MKTNPALMNAVPGINISVFLKARRCPSMVGGGREVADRQWGVEEVFNTEWQHVEDGVGAVNLSLADFPR